MSNIPLIMIAIKEPNIREIWITSVQTTALMPPYEPIYLHKKITFTLLFKLISKLYDGGVKSADDEHGSDRDVNINSSYYIKWMIFKIKKYNILSNL